MPSGRLYKVPRSSKAKKVVVMKPLKRQRQSLAKKALKIAKQNKKFIQKTIEMKQVNYHQNSTSINSNGFVAGSFCQIATGAEDGSTLGSSARIGNSVTLMRQQVCMNIAASATDTYNQFRVIIAESVDGNQQLALTDILEYGSYTLYGQNVFSSPYTTKTSTNKRYKIHFDQSFELAGVPTKGGKSTRVIKKMVRYGKTGKELEFAGPGSLNPNNHRLSIFLISDSVSATHPVLHYSVRSSYKDA